MQDGRGAPARERSSSIGFSGTQHEEGAPGMSELNARLLNEIVDAVKGLIRKETADRLRDVYLIGDIEKDNAKAVIERLRELANESRKPITLYINSAGGNVTDGLAIH